MNRRQRRRNVLKKLAIASTVGIGASIAGCSSPSNDASGGDDDGSEPTDAATDTPTESSSGGDDGAVETDYVEMTDDLVFEPQDIVVSAGTTVTWETTGAVGHTVTAYEDGIPDGAEYFASGDFDSEDAAKDGYPEEGNVTEGQTYEHTFETPGTYEYYCIPHEMNGMVGTVTVE